MSKYSAARKAGYSHNTAINAKAKLDDRIGMEFWLEAQGLTDNKLAEHAHNGLNANKTIGYLHQYKQKGKNGKLEKIKPDEVISNEFVEVPDWSARHKYLETILKLMGKIKETPLIDQSQHTHYTVKWEKNAEHSDRLPAPGIPKRDTR